MKKYQIGTAALSVAAIAVTLAACGKDQPSPASQNVDPRNMPQALAKPEDDWKQIKTFAQSIEGASLSYDAKTRTAKVAFNYRNVDVMGDDGVPVYTFIFELKGQVGADGTASLSDVRVPDYSAKLKCEDKDCLNAAIEISKTSGTIAGSATVKQTTLVNTNIFIGSSAGKASEKPNTTQAKVLKALLSGDPCSVDLTIKEVVGGRKNFFELRIRFSNTLRRPQDEDYFDAKEVALSGEMGQNVLVRLGYSSSKGYVSVGTSTPYHADVNYDASRAFVGTMFHENVVSKETEADLSISVGRELFPKKKDENK